GETLLQLLETRLDNLVSGLGRTNPRRAARQMVNHGHINVNGRRVSIASYNTKIGDVVEVRNNAVSRQLGTRGLNATQITAVPDWLLLDKDNFKGEVKRIPSREEIAAMVNGQLIID